jgi:sugar phosphate permease
LILLLAAVVNYLDRANLSIANTTISKEFGFSGTEMGLLLSAFLWPYALANLPAGWLVDRFGPKKMFTGALTLWSAVTFLMGFVNTYSFSMACGCCWGWLSRRSLPLVSRSPKAGFRIKSAACRHRSSIRVRKSLTPSRRRC